MSKRAFSDILRIVNWRIKGWPKLSCTTGPELGSHEAARPSPARGGLHAPSSSPPALLILSLVLPSEVNAICLL